MKKSVRQVLSLVMALCLLLSLVPAAFAAEMPVKTADALTAALETGGTVTLGADITVGERLTVSKDTVLDLNGYTLTVDTSGNIAVLVSAALTVRDSSGGERGKLTSGAYMTAFLDVPDSEEDAGHFPSNSLTLLSGTLENTQKGGPVIVAQGRGFSTVTVKGGTVRSEKGQAVFAQARTAISGGAFRGEVSLSLPEFSCHEITGGCFDLPFDGSLTGNKYSFYGTRYRAEASGDPDYPWHVTQAFDGGFTVSYQFPAGSGLSRRDDVFESGARIEEEPNAPDYADHSLRFEAWYTVDPDTGEARDVSYPLTVTGDMTLYARYVKEHVSPDDFDFDDPLNTLVVGGTVMVENGKITKNTVEGAGGGTARVWYDEENEVYALTLDTYVYSREGYAYTEKEKTGRFGIYAEGSLFLILDGESESQIDLSGESDAAYGIYVKEGSLAVFGGGTLEVDAASAASSAGAAGIYTDYRLLLVDACSVRVGVKGPAESLIGVLCNDLLIAGESKLSAKCKDGGNDCALSYGVFAEDEILIGESGVLDATGGSAPVKGGVSAGIRTASLKVGGPDCTVTAIGGSAGNMSCGVCAEGMLGISTDSTVTAVGGEARRSCGVMMAESSEDSYCVMQIKNGGVLNAMGGKAVVDSYGVQITNGVLAMYMDAPDEDEELEYGGILTLVAIGGEAVESYGVYVERCNEEDYPAILAAGGVCRARLAAVGGKAIDPDGGNGKSFGVWTDGDVVVDGVITKDSDDLDEPGVRLLVGAVRGSDHTHGICFDGDKPVLTVKNYAEVQARASEAAKGAVGIHFADDAGAISVSKESEMLVSAEAHETAAAINNVAAFAAGGAVSALADGETAYGIRMYAGEGGAEIDVPTGMVRAAGQTAAVIAVTDKEDAADVTVTAPAIEYSEDYEAAATELAETVEGTAVLKANEAQKYILAVAGGTIGELNLSGVDTALAYGSPVRFTAGVTPKSMVKVVEERWTCGDKVISSKDASPAVPAAGTYSYMLILEPLSDSFAFDDEVTVEYNGDYYFFDSEDGRLVLTNEAAGEVFVPDVTVAPPYHPPVDPGTGASSASSGEKKAETGMTRVELPASAGQVPVIVRADGSEEIVKLSYTENGVARALVPAGAHVKVTDAKPMAFGDVKGSEWYAGAVDFVTSRGIFRGTDLGFEPGRPMSRAMLATVLFRLSGEAAPAGGTAFGDVPANAWYAEAVAWAAGAGVVNGRGALFDPDAPVTREEIAVMLYRFMKHLERDVSASAPLTGFPDGGRTSDWAQEAMQWAVGAGLFQGGDNAALNPGGRATRAEIAAIVERLVKQIVG